MVEMKGRNIRQKAERLDMYGYVWVAVLAVCVVSGVWVFDFCP